MSELRRRVVVALALLLAVRCGAFGQNRQDAAMGVEELRALARNRPARMSSLGLSYQIFQSPSSFGHIAYMARTVLVDAAAGRFSMDESLEMEGTTQDFGTQVVTITFDGEVQGAFAPDPMIGIVKEGVAADGLVESGLWTVMLLSDPQPDGLGLDDLSLESLLAHGTVRHQLELVGDRPCHVVDAFYEGGRYATVWLDVERGLLPMKRAGYGHDGNVNSTVTVDAVMYLEDEQVWLPQSWQTEFQARGETLQSQTVVDPQSVQLDPTVSDEDFRAQFPPGTTVTDLIAGQTYTIAESGGIGEVLYEQGTDGEWRPVAPATAPEDAAGAEVAKDDPSATAPIFGSVEKLVEYATRAAQAKQSGRTESSDEAEATSPTVSIEPDASDSKGAARPEAVETAPQDLRVVDTSPEEVALRPAKPGVADAGRARSSGSPWTWIVGITSIVVLLGVGYSLCRRNPAG